MAQRRTIASIWSTGSGSTFPGASADAWVNQTHTLLTEVCGLVQTADTGQIPNPPALSSYTTTTSIGYRVYRFDDALQATAPISVRVDWLTRVSGNGTIYPRMRVWVGSATDGAGILSGNLVDFNQDSSSSTNVTPHGISRNSYAWGGDQGFWIVSHDALLAAASATSGINAASRAFPAGMFGVFRTTDADGTPNGDGWVVLSKPAHGPSVAAGERYLWDTLIRTNIRNSSTVIQDTPTPFAAPLIVNVAAISGNPVAYPLTQLSDAGIYPHVAAVALRNDSFNAFDQVEADFLGDGPYTYLNFGNVFGPAVARNESNAVISTAVALIWSGDDV